MENKNSNDGRGNFEKIILAGIGAIANTSEKAKEIVDELITKGELTVEQGKILNEELKHNVKSKISNDILKPLNEKVGLNVTTSQINQDDEEEIFLLDNLSTLNDDELNFLKTRISEEEERRKKDALKIETLNLESLSDKEIEALKSKLLEVESKRTATEDKSTT